MGGGVGLGVGTGVGFGVGEGVGAGVVAVKTPFQKPLSHAPDDEDKKRGPKEEKKKKEKKEVPAGGSKEEGDPVTQPEVSVAIKLLAKLRSSSCVTGPVIVEVYLPTKRRKKRC